MRTWVFEPREPLVLRDGRLAADGVNMRTLRFPWPSSLAGLARTLIGHDERGQFVLKDAEATRLLQVTVKGPWLVELQTNPKSGERSVKEQFFPAPADVIWHREADSTRVARRLAPVAPSDDGASSDLPDDLQLVAPLAPDVPATRADRGPAFFSWKAMEAWLTLPTDQLGWDERLGLDGLPVDERIHVGIDPEKGTADEGKLFGCEGLSFVVRDGLDGGAPRGFGLALGCEDPRLDGKRGPAHLGGERRIGLFRPAGMDLPGCVAVPADAKRLRLVLLTPGLFGDGYRPKDTVFGGAAKVVAAAVGRPQVVSGWDFAAGRPKASRRMAPAGSVYWVQLSDGVEPQAFARKWWFTSLCDDEQDARDGFGLALVGVQ